jgi:hypothetical protein
MNMDTSPILGGNVKSVCALLAALLGGVGATLFSVAPTHAFADNPVIVEWQPTAQVAKAAGSKPANGRSGTKRADAFVCDLYTHICVKFTKTETRAIASYVGPGLIGAVSWASYLCGKIPSGTGVVGCTAVVSIYAYLLDRSFNSAAANGKCVELHFPYTPVGGGFWWKTEGC